MKKIICLIVFVSACGFASAQRERQSIGLRLGDPSGLTYKKYLDKIHAAEFIIGSAGPDWHHTYYQNSFESVNAYESHRYRSHQVKSSLYLQGRYLVHDEIYVQGMEGKWDWYWGLGGVLKFAKVRYNYTPSDGTFEETDLYDDFDIGPEGIAGMEYTFEDVPVTVFGEVSLMLEIVNRVAFQPFAAAGVRYRF
jgi:hypothetical protein